MTVDASFGHAPDPFLPLPPLTDEAARTEALRCLYCADAACTQACPTSIDVASFIRKIATGNLEGSARTILASNPLGATCGAACPVERLCEGACVRTALDQPIAIGRLQRHAVESYAAAGGTFFTPGEDAGRAAWRSWAPVRRASPARRSCAGRAWPSPCTTRSRARAASATTGSCPGACPRETVALEVEQVERAGARFVLGTVVGRDVEPDGPGGGQRRGGRGGRPRARASASASPARTVDGVVDALDLIGRAIDGEGTPTPWPASASA